VPTPLIVCYHAVSATWDSPLAVSEDVLEAQLGALHRRGYAGFTFAEAERRRAAGTLPPRSAVVTFDDGYASTAKARPILDRLGWPATVFAVTSFTASGEDLAWSGTEHWRSTPHAHELTPLGWDGLAELAAAGWEVGSHTVSHPRLPELGDDALARELVTSRDAIAERLGRCETIAYPYGAVDRRVAAATAAAGYLAACTLPSALTIDEPHLRPRVGLYERDTGARLWLKVSRTGLRARRSRLAGAVLGPPWSRA
jgi:peptidoglycan/xylan/chitin deacetylase (PgdA/CDA1 family)